jgi:hypothetical protein
MARTPPAKQTAQKPAKTDEPQAPQRLGRIAPVGGQARGVAAAAFLKMGFTDPALVLRWNEIAGPEVARLAQPLKLSGDCLTLRAVPGAALFLGHEKRALCERINGYLGRAAVAQIKFSQGAPLPATPAAPPQKPAGPLPPADPSRRYDGPEGLGRALQALARRRAAAS